jgi:DNA-binding protein YbaB
MKKIDKKENLPIEFITNFLSEMWKQLGDIQGQTDRISEDFNKTKKIKKIFQNYINVSLDTLNQLELLLIDEDYINNYREDKKEEDKDKKEPEFFTDF